MKWVKAYEGKWSLVEDSDPRPEDKKFANRKVSKGTFTTSIRPPWVSEVDVHKLANDADANVAYSESMTKEKEKWTATGKWAKWERERKAAAMANKPEWIRRGSLASERDDAIRG